MFDKIPHLTPIEYTVQNLYFHDSGSIFSISDNGNAFITSGADKEIRLWTVSDVLEQKRSDADDEEKTNMVLDNSTCDGVNKVTFGNENRAKSENFDCKDKQESESMTKPQLNMVNSVTENEGKQTEQITAEVANDKTENMDHIKQNSVNNKTVVVACTTANTKMLPGQDTKDANKFFVTNEAYHSTVKINYTKTFSHHQKPVNCVRFSECKKYFASCADGGEVCVWKDDKKLVVKDSDGDDAYDLTWIGLYLAVGTAAGKIYLYSVLDNTEVGKDSQGDVHEHKQEQTKNQTDKTADNSDTDTCIRSPTVHQQSFSIDTKENFANTDRLSVASGMQTELKSKRYDIKQESIDKHNESDLGFCKSTLDHSELDICAEITDETITQDKMTATEDTESKPVLKKIKITKTNKPRSQYQNFKCKHIQTIKAHSDIIQGMAHNPKYDAIVSCSKDRTAKTFYLDKKLVYIDKIDSYKKEKCFADENSKTLFRRPAFSHCGKFCYLPACLDDAGNNCVLIIHYPFRSIDFFGKIGPLDSPATKILCTENSTIVMCKKSIFYIENNCVVFSIKNASFFPLTDCCYIFGVYCFTSLDGFIYTLKLKLSEKKYVM